MKIGRPVFRLMGESAPDYISSDCAIAGRHIQQGMGGREAGGGKAGDSKAGDSTAQKQHPITLIRIAYGL